MTKTPRLPWPLELTSEPGWTMQRSREQLSTVLATTWGAVKALAASTLDVPQFEFKLAAGVHLYELVELAAQIEHRLRELSVRLPSRALASADRRRLTLTLAADAATDRIGLVYGYWIVRLRAELAAAYDATDSLLDAPSARILRLGMTELECITAWGETATRAACAGSDLAPRLRELETVEAGDDEPYPERPRAAARDERFSTFEDTRSYRKASDWIPGATAYESDVIELLRVNRDEIDAIETFALSLHDLADTAPIEALAHLARLAWDEARHAAIGQIALAERGLEPFDLSCSLIGINVRAAMDGYDAWAQITLFGELGIIRPMRELAQRARAQSDQRTAAIFDFVCSDEVLHLRESRALLDRLHPAGGLERVAETVRSRAAVRLEELGVMKEEQFLALSREEIFALVGE